MVLLCVDCSCILSIISIVIAIATFCVIFIRTNLITSVNLKKGDANSNKQDKLEITVTIKDVEVLSMYM